MLDITPLHRAAAIGHAQEVRALIYQSAEFDPRNRYGQTPLHLAVLRENAEVVRVLVNSGADINARNDYGDTPAKMALSNGLKDLAGLLR